MAARSAGSRHALGSAAGVVLLTAGLGLVAAAPATAAPATAAAPSGAAAPYCTTSWNGGSGAWGDATRWSTGVVPGADDYVCVLRATGAAVPVVTLGASTTVHTVTMAGATLRLPTAGTVLTLAQLEARRSQVTGRGTVQGTQWGATIFAETRLGGGLALLTDGSVLFRGGLTLSGGARVVQSFLTAYTTFEGDVTVADGDGHPANHLTLYTHGTEIAAGTEVAIEVPFAARNSTLTVLGTLRLPRYDGLDTAGALAPTGGDYVRFRTYDAGRIELPRSVTRLAPGTILEGSAALVTPEGGDALTTMSSIGGTLDVYRPLDLPNPLEVAGRLQTSASVRVPSLTVLPRGTVTVYGGGLPATATLTTPLVWVAPGAGFSASVLTGRAESGGRTALAGARWGELQLAATAASTMSLSYPATVNGAAQLAGAATVSLPRPRQLPADGARIVLLTAAGGLTSQFASVRTAPPALGSVTLEYTPTQVVAVFHAPPPSVTPRRA